jgi:hypothetical protein
MTRKLPPPQAGDTPALGDIIHEIAELEGRLSVHPLSGVEGARVLEGLRACLEAGPRGEVLAAFAKCSAQLRHAAKGARSPSLLVAADEKGRQAERLRDTVGLYLRTGARDPLVLASIVDVTRRGSPGKGESLFPRAPAVSEMQKAIKDLLADAPRTGLDEAIICACLRLAGVQRPSALFDRERKAEERRGK